MSSAKPIRVKNGKLGYFPRVELGQPLSELYRCALFSVLDPAQVPGVGVNRTRYSVERKTATNPDFFEWCIHG